MGRLSLTPKQASRARDATPAAAPIDFDPSSPAPQVASGAETGYECRVLRADVPAPVGQGALRRFMRDAFAHMQLLDAGYLGSQSTGELSRVFARGVLSAPLCRLLSDPAVTKVFCGLKGDREHLDGKARGPPESARGQSPRAGATAVAAGSSSWQ